MLKGGRKAATVTRKSFDNESGFTVTVFRYNDNDERECNYWCSCRIWGKYFIYFSSIFTVPVLRLNKPDQINRQSLRLQYIVHRAKICREERFLMLPTLEMSNFCVLPFVLISLAKTEAK